MVTKTQTQDLNDLFVAAGAKQQGVANPLDAGESDGGAADGDAEDEDETANPNNAGRAEDNDEGTEDDAGAGDDGEGEDGAGEEGGTNEADDSEGIRTVAQLAKAIDVEPEFLYDIEIGMGDGEDPVKLGELKDKYTALLKTSGEQTTQLEEQSGELNNVADMTQQGQGVSQEMMAAFSRMDAIKQQYEGTDWKAMEEDDPGEAALMKQKFQEAFNAAQGQVQQAQKQMQDYKAQVLQKAGESMLRLMPDWTDIEVRKEAQAGIRKLLLAEGANDNYINQIQDPVAMKLLNELVQWRAKGKAAADAVHKVHKAPKVLKNAGKFKPNPQKNLAKLKEAARTARPSGRKNAEMAAVKALLGASVKQKAQGRNR